MSMSEGITFDDELAMYQEGIDPGDRGVPVEVDDEETTPLPSESMADVVFGGAA